jgi:group II intron reverse transcriptase/maturase
MGMLSRQEGLRDSFERQAGSKAPGVDGMRKAEYAEGLEDRITDLSVRLRQLGYRPKPSRRVLIPKATGGRRPLGVPSFEDRIVQDRMSRILQAIWEPEFRKCSYGFRPHRGAHDALRRVAEVITNERTQWVVEADIKGFFDNLSHRHLMRFLGHRIGDGRFLRIVKRFLKAGVLNAGAYESPRTGTPQGGLVSPVLANIYLHYVLDWWFEAGYAKSCRGKAFLIRYADDFLACFEREEDAKRFLKVLPERLAKFDLEAEPTKTRLLSFGTRAWQRRKTGGPDQTRTFRFLGLTHYMGTSRAGRFVVGRRTDCRRFRKKLVELGRRLRDLRTEGGQAMVVYVQRHLRGHIQYYGVSGNTLSLRSYAYHAAKLLFKWLNRRSQKRSLTYERFYRLLDHGLLPRARIVHDLYPKPMWMTCTGSRMR